MATTAAAAALYFSQVDTSLAQNLTPSNVFMSAYHAPQIGGVAVPETRANAFTAITDGITGGGNGLDTFNLDGFGIVKDFVGLEYGTPQRFDTITVNLGNQFPDGGDWEAKPKIYILKNRTLTGDMVEPNLSPNWVEVTGAVETTGHVFSNSAPGPGGMVRFDLSSIPAAQRSGWGWAVGGVDGSANGSGVWNFISVTDASATGAATGVAPAYTPPSTPVPTNVVTNLVNSLGRGATGLGAAGLIDGNRGQAFASVTNGLLDRTIGLGNDGFDTSGGDPAGTLTDFVGLQYGSAYRFDTLKVELGRQFGIGGDWQSTPKIYILKNPVDTATSRPETDPTNWLEVTGAIETTGHAFNPIALNGAGGTINFSLSSIPANQRTGWGWAIGGVDGNQDAGGGANFISVTEASATGALIPGPFEVKLEVNTTTGATRLLNSTPFNMSLDFYRVTSASGSLNVPAWNSLESPTGNPGAFPAGNGSGNGWEGLGNASDKEVAEAYLQNSSTLIPGASATLGNLFSVGETQDLGFRYRAPDGLFYDAAVQYVTGGFLSADFNQSGAVDGADLTIWQTAYGSTSAGDADADGDTDGRDFLLWQRQFGTSPLSAATAVPEPAMGVLLASAAVGIVLSRWRCSRLCKTAPSFLH
jgi:hypothetical protein